MASFGIGAKLRQERLSLGRSVEDVARETRISEKFLDAIEREDFERLPGLLFTRNFVRQYAQSLRLDPDPLLAELPKPDESAVRLPEAPRACSLQSRPADGTVCLVRAGRRGDRGRLVSLALGTNPSERFAECGGERAPCSSCCGPRAHTRACVAASGYSPARH